jgi:hypothetical protein
MQQFPEKIEFVFLSPFSPEHIVLTVTKGTHRHTRFPHRHMVEVEVRFFARTSSLFYPVLHDISSLHNDETISCYKEFM